MRRKAVKIVTTLAAGLALVLGIGVITAPTAAAASPISSWKWNAANIEVKDDDGKIVKVKPGKNAYDAGSRVRARELRVPSYCVATWGPGLTTKNYMKGGVWINLPWNREYFGGKVYLHDPPGKRKTYRCNRA